MQREQWYTTETLGTVKVVNFTATTVQYLTTAQISRGETFLPKTAPMTTFETATRLDDAEVRRQNIASCTFIPEQ
ncbi:hypothetical protein [Lacticaseibacillus saniviri]|uniref:Uncharacterized protein n=1 Tax=Lacticaseibacillus saniviri JCM 17471 = DSM 24301 TaxID=1293598 RepID=A0A0R2N2A5_9LACO|nr:hypothetical protein [Lacticaseibacillus saniviri]KRO17130.1 hypothetical protein IV56_GL000454 [Lacticaseibacillus saniviri JCM 17471 = DSM 24301]MCG4282938.1 hypothetical protein [Lacticaseibacillus saniviri]